MGKGNIVKEKKKQKQKKSGSTTGASISSAPIFTMPEVHKKKEKWG